MGFLKRHFEMIYWWSTLATFIGSVACMGFLLLADMMIGFDSIPFNWLMGLTLAATLCLLLGVAFALSQNRYVALMIAISSAYLPVTFIVLAMNGYGPPISFWFLFFTNIMEVTMASIRFVQLGSSEVAQWQ